MLFSVVIPTYNRVNLLARTLNSVWAQRFTDFEVIVVDNGSTDATAAYLQSLGGRVRGFTTENRGAGAARNYGAQQARGDYVAFLDDDDLWFPWTLSVFSELIAKHDRPTLLSAKLQGFRADEELSAVSESPVKVEAFADYLASKDRGYFVGAGMAVVRRERFLEVGGFVEDRANAEDHDLVLRLGLAPGFVQVLDPVTLGWRRHPSSSSMNIRLGIEGHRRLLAGECSGRYPGGRERLADRWKIITRAGRPLALECLRRGAVREGFELYSRMFWMHVRLMRWRFLVGFLLTALARSFCRRTPAMPSLRVSHRETEAPSPTGGVGQVVSVVPTAFTPAQKDHPLFSVVIPTFNRRELLELTLKSVWSQSLPNFEIIVVDDGSSDGTLEYLRSLGRRIQVVESARRGPAAARNLGVSSARGEYIAFLDSDDLWFPWTLETYAVMIRESNTPAFIAGKPFRFTGKGVAAGVSKDGMEWEKFADYLASGNDWRWWGVSSFVVRRANFLAVGGFAEENVNGEDGDLALRLGESPGFVQTISPYTFGYREHDSNLTSNLAKSIGGAWHKILAEREGAYPGGSLRCQIRREIITRHVRPIALECLRRSRQRDGINLYKATFSWHLGLFRLKFILAFFPLAIWSTLRGPRTN